MKKQWYHNSTPTSLVKMRIWLSRDAILLLCRPDTPVIRRLDLDPFPLLPAVNGVVDAAFREKTMVSQFHSHKPGKNAHLVIPRWHNLQGCPV
jgi:hypothetical protein